MNQLNKYKFHLTILLLASLINFSSSAAIDKDKNNSKPKCIIAFKDKEMDSIFETCVTSLNIKFPEEPLNEESAIKYFDKIEKSGFDDQCLGKCLAEKHDMLTQDSHFNKESFLVLKEATNASAQAKDIIMNGYLNCADKVEMKAKAEDGMKNNECKYMAMFRHCLFKEGLKKRDELDALC